MRVRHYVFGEANNFGCNSYQSKNPLDKTIQNVDISWHFGILVPRDCDFQVHCAVWKYLKETKNVIIDVFQGLKKVLQKERPFRSHPEAFCKKGGLQLY